MIDSIRTVINSVDKNQSRIAKIRALNGSVRAVSTIWHEKKAEVYGDTVWQSFTGKDLGNFKDLIKRYGAQDTIALIEWTVENWKRLINLPYLRLPPTPVVSSFYAQREQIIAAWQESKKVSVMPELKMPEMPVDPPGTIQKSLVELLLEKRKERAHMLRAGKDHEMNR